MNALATVALSIWAFSIAWYLMPWPTAAAAVARRDRELGAYVRGRAVRALKHLQFAPDCVVTARSIWIMGDGREVEITIKAAAELEPVEEMA